MALAAPLLLTGGLAAHAKGPDTSAPIVAEYSVTSNDGDDDLRYFIEHEPATFTIKVRVTDETGLDRSSGLFNPPNPVITVSSTDTDQSVGFGGMTLVSGDEKDGWYEKTVTIPEGRAPGEWKVKISPLEDTLGNSTGLGDFAFFGTLGIIEIVYGTPVEPAAVVFDEEAYTYTVPEVEGVEYLVDGSVVAAGTYPATGDVTVTARAIGDYVLDGEDSWSHSFVVEEVVPAAVTFQDENGKSNDTYTVPSTTGVEYEVNGEVVAAGTYPASGEVVAIAHALPGYVLSGESTWSHTFNDSTKVSAKAVTFSDKNGAASDTYTVPAVTGIEYLVDGKVVKAGTYTATGTVKVTARALDGFTLTGTTTWSHAFDSTTAVKAEPVEFTDNSGTARDSYTVPSATGVEYLVGGKVVKAGTYTATGTVKVSARALDGYTLSGTATWSKSFTALTPFIDVKPGVEHYDAMMWMWDEGVSTGWKTSQGPEYRALSPVNRDAMAAFLYRQAGSPAVDLPAKSPFTDMHPGKQHYEAVIWAYNEGITTGWKMKDGTYQFRPVQPIARDAMAAFLYRFAGEPAYTAPSGRCFTDVAPDMKFADEMCWMKTEGISKGWSNGTYRPLSPVKRDAMAAFLQRYDAKL